MSQKKRPLHTVKILNKNVVCYTTDKKALPIYELAPASCDRLRSQIASGINSGLATQLAYYDEQYNGIKADVKWEIVPTAAMLKAAIKKAITDNSSKFRATKVWKIEDDGGDLEGDITLRIEVTVRRKPKRKVN